MRVCICVEIDVKVELDIQGLFGIVLRIPVASTEHDGYVAHAAGHVQLLSCGVDDLVNRLHKVSVRARATECNC